MNHARARLSDERVVEVVEDVLLDRRGEHEGDLVEVETPVHGEEQI